MASRVCSPNRTVLFTLVIFLSLLSFGIAAETEPEPEISAKSSSALATITTASSEDNVRAILIPALHSMISAPLHLLRQLLLELSQFVWSKQIGQLIWDFRSQQSILARLFARLLAHWRTLISVEAQCLRRSLCELADFASRRLPKWATQVTLIYLTTFSSTNEYMQVLLDGMSNHRCAVMYGSCDADRLLERLKANITESVVQTVGPVNEAIGELVNVTAKTVRSLLLTETGQNGDETMNLGEKPKIGSKQETFPPSAHFQQPANTFPRADKRLKQTNKQVDLPTTDTNSRSSLYLPHWAAGQEN